MGIAMRRAGETSIVVAGGGIAGVSAAVRIQKILRRKDAVTLVSNSPTVSLRQSFTRMAFGMHADTPIPDVRKTLPERGIRFVVADIHSIDSKHNVLRTSGGEVRYDYLLLALGAVGRENELPGGEEALSTHSRAAALKTREAMEKLSSGSMHCVSAEGNPWEGPGLEAAFCAKEFLTQRGRGDVAVNYVTDRARPFTELGTKVSGVVENELAERGIRLWTDEKVKSITPRSLITSRRMLASQLSILFPPLAGNPVLSGSGIADSNNFVPVDSHLRSLHSPNVFAAGDCMASASPKTGFGAASAAATAAENISAELLGHPLKEYSPRMAYVMELGDGSSLLFSAHWTSGGWKATVRKGTIPFARKLGFERAFLESGGDINFMLGEKLA